jgi:HAE1 family hydrophobic/amphiphilic exporter-1
MIILSLVVVGAASYGQLGVDRFPPVDLPTVMVRAQLPARRPRRWSPRSGSRSRRPVNTVQGISELRRSPARGTAIVVVTFALDRDIDAATQDVRDRVAAALPEPAARHRPAVVRKFDNDSSASSRSRSPPTARCAS